MKTYQPFKVTEELFTQVKKLFDRGEEWRNIEAKIGLSTPTLLRIKRSSSFTDYLENGQFYNQLPREVDYKGIPDATLVKENKALLVKNMKLTKENKRLVAENHSLRRELLLKQKIR
jgi:hypothetical protein